jgi:site-specific recombinase XerD
VKYDSAEISIVQSNFIRIFENLCSSAGIPKDLAYPHVLRHTRTLELVQAGVSLTIVQKILGHSNLNTTATYFKFSGQEAEQILKDRGLL